MEIPVYPVGLLAYAGTTNMAVTSYRHLPAEVFYDMTYVMFIISALLVISFGMGRVLNIL